MQQNYQTTKLPTSASQVTSKFGASWLYPERITANDGSSSSVGFFQGGDSGAIITGDDFEFNLPPEAVIDGISVLIDGVNVGCDGIVTLGITGTTGKAIGTLNTTYGSISDLWGASSITRDQVAAMTVSVDAGDVSGGDGYASIDHLSVTIYWHIDLSVAPANVPVRFDYKVYSRDGSYLGLLPNVTSKFAVSQDVGSAGSSIQITCGNSVQNEVIVNTTPILTNEDEAITTEDDIEILAGSTSSAIVTGSSPENAMFKNSNRIKVWMYNYWYPNGKLMFSGQVNRISFKYGGDNTTQLLVLSDGLDFSNFIARGYPFAYTNDVVQNTQNGHVTVITYPLGGWVRYGQSFRTGAAVTNAGAISLLLLGTANVTVSLYDAPNGNLLGNVTKSISNASALEAQFEFPQLINVNSDDDYFFAISVPKGQSIDVYYHSTSSTYPNGSMYNSTYSGGGGGGSYDAVAGDLWFITKSGSPTTTTTYSNDDPVTDMAHGILLDYNARGGRIKEREFTATGLSLTYTFNSATILDAIKKIIEMSPSGYYSYVDLGTSEIDILPVSTTPDFVIVRGKDMTQLTISMSIEQVKNYLLFSGGDTGGGVNLFRQYSDAESAAYYGTRLGTKSDNRVILDATADAIGDAFMDENADEMQETSLIINDSMVDISLFTPGKTIGFRNFGNLIDDMVLMIARRDINYPSSTLVLGRLPIVMNAELQRINNELLMQQTINNPTQPT